MECTVYQTVKKSGVERRYVEQVVLRVVRTLKKHRATVSVHLIGDARMARLNTTYRGMRQTTDVLSFPTQENGLWKGHEHDWGDIFISVPQIRRQALEHGISYKEELTRMLVHGTLHLFGYDHGTTADAKRMIPLQERLVKISV